MSIDRQQTAGRSQNRVAGRNGKAKVARGLTLKTHVKAGGLFMNHNETLLTGLTLKTHVKAGGVMIGNHNEMLSRGAR